jgi:hypothetical protein
MRSLLSSFLTTSLFIGAVSLASCSDGRPASEAPVGAADGTFEERAIALETADVEHDVEVAVTAGDMRFLCVTGEGVVAPGVPAAEFLPGSSEPDVDTTRFRIIDHTYDDLDPTHSESIRRFKLAAAAYALEYNRQLALRSARN